MVRKCKSCKQKITLQTIKEEAEGNKKRMKAIYKDYSICYTSSYCIKCLRKQKQTPLMNRLGIKKRKVYESKEELEADLIKQGHTPEEIKKELGKYEGLIK